MSQKTVPTTTADGDGDVDGSFLPLSASAEGSINVKQRMNIITVNQDMIL